MYTYNPVTCFSQLLILYINISDILMCHLCICYFIVSLDCSLLNNRVTVNCSQKQVCVSMNLFLYFWDQKCFLCANSQSIILKNSLFFPFLLHFNSNTVSWDNASCHTYSLTLFFSFPVKALLPVSFSEANSLAFIMLNDFQLCLFWIMILLALSFLYFAFILIKRLKWMQVTR